MSYTKFSKELTKWLEGKRYKELISCAHGGWYSEDKFFEPLAIFFIEEQELLCMQFLCERSIRFIIEDLLFVQNLDELHSQVVTEFGVNFYKQTKTKPMSLAFVRNFPNINILRVSDNEYTDYKVLADIKELKTLLISNVTLNEIESIADLEIERLSFDSCRLNCDLTCLAMAKIHSFGFSAKSLKKLSLMEIGTKVKAEDFRVLLELPYLESVYIDYFDFGKNRIKSVRTIFQEAGKEHLLKSGIM